MRMLAIDTSGPFGSIALAEDERALAEQPLYAPQGFGYIIFPEIERLLERQGWLLHNVDAFAAAAGPGSFTGVRLALTVVKGLADALKKPTYAVSNLQALAACGHGALRAAVIDARRGEAYCAVYNAELDAIRPEVVAAFGPWIAGLPDGNIEFLSTGFDSLRPSLTGTIHDRAKVSEHRHLAGAVARVAAAKGSPCDAASLDANYVRHADLRPMWKEM